MVEKMHFINFAGPIGELDTFVLRQVVKHEIQLVNAYSILSSVQGTDRFMVANPYQKLVEKIKLLGEVGEIIFKYDESVEVSLMPIYSLGPEIDEYERQLETIRHIRRTLKETLDYKKQLRSQLVLIQNLEVQVDKLFKFDYMKFRFGSMPIDAFEKAKEYSNALDLIMYEVSQAEGIIYLVYFTPRAEQKDMDNMFAALHFKRIRLSDDIKGIPREALEKLEVEIEDLEKRIGELEEESKEYVQKNMRRIQELYTRVTQLDAVFNTRDLAARSKEAFYLAGWVADSQLKLLERDMKDIPNVSYVIETDDEVRLSEPPTKLNNPKFFKPFEALVNMYGLPSYDEWDPTIFVAIVYMLLFGAMFGDVGQGIVFAFAGWLFQRKTGAALGKIMIYLGSISCLFGFVYGSFFGDEHFLGNLLGYNPIRPMEMIMEILLVAIGIGVALVVIAMLLNIKNAYHQHNIGKMLFDRNGVAGLFFYLVSLGITFAVVMQIKVHLWLILLLTIGPLILIFLSHPLSHLLDGDSQIFPKEKGGYIIEMSFELIETLIAFLSNTISFIRIGAFALNHVGFFLAFHMLSSIVGESYGTVGSVLVMVFGNILIIVLEGLIVGIQGMRLIYYELFSRFFEGEGKAFKPFRIRKS